MNDNFMEYLDEVGAETEDTLERLGGNKSEYLEYLNRFTEDNSIIVLRQAVSQRNAEAAMAAVHTLKGVALNLGLLPVADVCMDMLLDFRAGNNAQAFSGFDVLDETFGKWVEIIKSIGAEIEF